MDKITVWIITIILVFFYINADILAQKGRKLDIKEACIKYELETIKNDDYIQSEEEKMFSEFFEALISEEKDSIPLKEKNTLYIKDYGNLMRYDIEGREIDVMISVNNEYFYWINLDKGIYLKIEEKEDTSTMLYKFSEQKLQDDGYIKTKKKNI